jgi:hypothetical protein
MKENETRILGISISDRVKKVDEVQNVLTKFGCSIKTRLGLHEVVDDECSINGTIILELSGDMEECIKLENELLKIEGLDVQKMVFRK